MQGSPSSQYAYWQKCQRDPVTNARVVCVFVTINDVNCYYRFTERNGEMLLHSYQDERQMEKGEEWITDFPGLSTTVFRFGAAEAVAKARCAFEEWDVEESRLARIAVLTRIAEEKKRQAEMLAAKLAAQQEAEREAKQAKEQALEQARLNAKLDAERRAALEAKREARREAAREAEKAMAAAARAKRLEEEERKKSTASAIGVIGLVVAMGAWLILWSVGLALLGLLLSGIGFGVWVVCLVYNQSFDPPSHRPTHTTTGSHLLDISGEDGDMAAFRQGTISGYYGENGPAFMPPDFSKMTNRQKGMFVAGMQQGDWLDGHK